GGGTDRAIDYAVRAAAHANGLLAYEESVRFHQAALEVLELAGGDPPRRCDLLLGLGESNWRTGAEPAAWDAYFRAAMLAREIEDAERMGWAALGPGSMTVMFGLNLGQPTEHELQLLEEALEMLEPQDSPLRVRLLS